MIIIIQQHMICFNYKGSYENETFRKITSTRTYQIPPTNKQKETRYLRNHHKFIVKMIINLITRDYWRKTVTQIIRFTPVTVAKG